MKATTRTGGRQKASKTQGRKRQAKPLRKTNGKAQTPPPETNVTITEDDLRTAYRDGIKGVLQMLANQEGRKFLFTAVNGAVEAFEPQHGSEPAETNGQGTHATLISALDDMTGLIATLDVACSAAGLDHQDALESVLCEAAHRARNIQERIERETIGPREVAS